MFDINNQPPAADTTATPLAKAHPAQDLLKQASTGWTCPKCQTRMSVTAPFCHVCEGDVMGAQS